MLIEACAIVCTIFYVASTIGVIFQQREHQRLTAELTGMLKGFMARQGLDAVASGDESEEEEEYDEEPLIGNANHPDISQILAPSYLTGPSIQRIL